MSRNLDYLIVGVDISKENLDKRLKQAEERITQSSNADECFEAYLEKGQILQKLERYSESKEPLEEAKKLNPESPELLIRLGNVYDEEKKFDEAIAYYSEGLSLCDSYAYGHCMLGQAYFHRVHFYKAYLYNKKPDKEHNYYSDYDKAIEIDKDCFLAYKLKGFAYYKEEEFEKAIENYNKVIEIKNNDFNAYHTLGGFHAAKGDFGKAFDNYIMSAYYKCNRKIIKKIDIEELGKNKDKEKFKYFPYYFKEFISDLMRFNMDITDDYKKLLGTLYVLWHLSYSDNQDKNVNNSYIYRYTSLDALNKTIENRSLRLSPANYQNDPKEGKAFFEKIEQYIEKEEEDKKKDMLNWLAEIKSKSTEENITTFICCFSGNPDYIPMWNSSYGRNGEGCAIGIDKAKIKEIRINSGSKVITPKKHYVNLAELYKVIYVNFGNQTDSQNSRDIITVDYLLRNIADCLQSIFDSDEFKSGGEKREHIINALAKLFSQIAHMMKYDDYEIENEYRLIYTAQIADLSDYIHNDNINDGIYLYTERKLFLRKSKLAEKSDEVLLGPVVGEIKRFKIEHQIKSRKYDVKVKHSKVPYRKA